MSTRPPARRSSTTATGCRATTRRAPGATTATRAGRGRRSRWSRRAGTRRARSSTRSRCRRGGWWSRRRAPAGGSRASATRRSWRPGSCGAAPAGDNVPRRKVFLADAQGLVPSTWWTHEEAGHNAEASAEQRRLFPGERPFSTPKPERLMARIVGDRDRPGRPRARPVPRLGHDRGGRAQARARRGSGSRRRRRRSSATPSRGCARSSTGATAAGSPRRPAGRAAAPSAHFACFGGGGGLSCGLNA